MIDKAHLCERRDAPDLVASAAKLLMSMTFAAGTFAAKRPPRGEIEASQGRSSYLFYYAGQREHGRSLSEISGEILRKNVRSAKSAPRSRCSLGTTLRPAKSASCW